MHIPFARALACLAMAAPLMAHATAYSVFDMGSPGDNRIHTTDINDLGQVVGYTATVYGNPLHTSLQFFVSDAHGADWRSVGTPISGTLLDFTTLSVNVKELDLTESGQIIGSLSSRQTVNGPVTEQKFTIDPADGVMKSYEGTLPGEGPPKTYPPVDLSAIARYAPATSSATNLDVNAKGQVAGYFLDPYVVNPRGFITDAHGAHAQEIDQLSFTNFTIPQGDRPAAFEFFGVPYAGLNAGGEFTVWAQDGHNYLLSPVPEPGTVALMLAGLGLVAFKGRRRGLSAGR